MSVCFTSDFRNFTSITILEISHKNPDFCFFLIIKCFGHIEPAIWPENRELELCHSSLSSLSIYSAPFYSLPITDTPKQCRHLNSHGLHPWCYLSATRFLWLPIMQFWFLGNVDYFRQNIKMDGLGNIILLAYTFLKYKWIKHLRCMIKHSRTLYQILTPKNIVSKQRTRFIMFNEL